MSIAVAKNFGKHFANTLNYSVLSDMNIYSYQNNYNFCMLVQCCFWKLVFKILLNYMKLKQMLKHISDESTHRSADDNIYVYSLQSDKYAFICIYAYCWRHNKMRWPQPIQLHFWHTSLSVFSNTQLCYQNL